MHPVLLNLHGFLIYSYGAMLVIAFMLATAVAQWQGKRREYNPDAIMDLVMGCILSGIAGCRLGFVLQYPNEYLHRPLAIFNLREGGMTITGGVVLGAAWICWHYRKRPGVILSLLDFSAAPLLLGMAWGRIGCLLHGCCFGAPTNLPWGITYPAGTLPAGLAIVPRHPSPIYEALMDLVLFPILLWQLPRLKFAGQNFYLFFAGYGVIRFLDEMTRYIDVYWGPLGMYQWICIGFFLFGVAGLLGLFGKPAPNLNLFPRVPAKSTDADSGDPPS